MSDNETFTPDLLLDRYRIEGKLGEGGLGTVMRAFDTRLRRPVAIKSLKRSIASLDPTQLRAIEDRFSREAIAGSRMGSHPNLVAVYDTVAGPDETLYLILEYIPGGTLDHRLRRLGPRDIPEAMRLTADIARGLHAAHEAGVVHRDIKPANIFIAADGRAQVGDFGIAQIDDVSARTSTATGHPGTPLYMSPEQASTTGYLRATSDEYSLGLVLFEVLTGKAYKRLSTTEINTCLAAWPEPVQAMMKRLLEENPEHRYPDMMGVVAAAQAIATVMDADPILITTPSPQPDPAPTLFDPPPVAALSTPPPTPPPVVVSPAAQSSRPPIVAQPVSAQRVGRRAALFAIGGVVLVGAAGGGYLFVERNNGNASPTPPAGPAPTDAATGGADTAVPPAAPATATPVPQPTATPAPTSTPVVARFGAGVITDAMSHPEQWQMDKIPNQSLRTLADGTYSVQVFKKPDGSGLFTWGDWVPAPGVRGPEFIAEVEMRLQGDAAGAAGGLIFLYNYVSNVAQYQYLSFQLRGDGRFTIAQQLPGGEGHDRKFVDMAQHPALIAGTDAINVLRVEVRQGKFSCFANNQPVYMDQPVPVEVAGFSALSFSANVLKTSVEPNATAIYSKLRYEKVSS